MANKSQPRRTGGNGSSDWRKKMRGVVKKLTHPRVRPYRVFLGLMLVIGYTALLEADLFQAGITWKVGDIAPRDIYADRTHEFVDERETEQLRRTASEQVAKVYEALPVQQEAVNRINQLFQELGATVADADLTTAALQQADVADRVRPLVWFEPDAAWIQAALRLTDPQRDVVRDEGLRLLSDIYGGSEIRDDVPQDLDAARKDLEERLAELPPAQRAVLRPILLDDDILKPNRRYNAEATVQRRQEAADDVEPVRRTINRGQLIVQRGHVVSDQDLADLKALGLVQPKRDWSGLFSLGCLVSLVLVILGTYVRLEQPEVFYDDRRIILLNLLCAMFLVTFRLLLWLKGEIPSLAHPAIFCGASTGMVVAVLVEYRLAMMMTGAMGLFMGILLPGAALWVAIEAWLAGRVGAMALRHVKDRDGLAKAGLMVAVAGMMIAAVVQLPRSGDVNSYQPLHLTTDLLFGFGWGLMAFLVAQGLIPLLERAFSCVTPFRLLELANTSPLLDMLKREGRGSFDSSLTIGDMAADAAEAIGADPLLAKAAGYHHDIGKMKHPGWFIENQFGGENVHNVLEPQISAMAIKSHVTLGAELAREYQLPKPLYDVIMQHHGTTLISFFYYQALESAADGQTVDESQFRYPGPKPQFKESGIIMLADGIEASVRAASAHGPMTEKLISEKVNKLMRDRLDEGQLDECDLTLRELNQVSQAFIQFLKGMYHNRIDYPAGAQAKREKKPGKADAGKH